MKKIGHWIYSLILATLLLLLIVTALLQTTFVREKVISLLKDKIHEKMGYTITYTELKGSPPFFFAFTDLNISREGEHLFFARQISISWAPWHLLAGGIVASHIDAHHVIIGSIEWEEPLPQELKSSWNPSYFAINDFHFSHFSQLEKSQKILESIDLKGSFSLNTKKDLLYLKVSGVPTSKDIPLPALAILTLEGEKKNFQHTFKSLKKIMA